MAWLLGKVEPPDSRWLSENFRVQIRRCLMDKTEAEFSSAMKISEAELDDLLQRRQITPEEQERLLALMRAWKIIPAASSKPALAAAPWAAHMVKVREVPIYGYAQALGARMHKGDLVPDNIHELETVTIIDDGRRYAAFRVEGESMAPGIRDGVTALADPDRELANKCIVVCKWDDTVTIKRYSRDGDIIYLRSDNPAEGENFKVHAKKMEWCMRVVRLSVEV